MSRSRFILLLMLVGAVVFTAWMLRKPTPRKRIEIPVTVQSVELRQGELGKQAEAN